MALWKTCLWVRKSTLVPLSIVDNYNLSTVRKAQASPPTSGSRPTTPLRTATTRVQPPRRAVLALGVHADDHLAEVASLQQAEKGSRRLLQAVDDILASGYGQWRSRHRPHAGM